jgi:hypothetical protein
MLRKRVSVFAAALATAERKDMAQTALLATITEAGLVFAGSAALFR